MSEGWNDCPVIIDITSARHSKKKGTKVNIVEGEGDFLAHHNISLTEDEITQEIILQRLETVLAMPNKLSSKEMSYYSKKVKSNMPKIMKKDAKSEFKQVAYEIISDCTTQSSLEKGKELLTSFMLVNPDQVGWALPLQKIIDNISV